ncbi:MAG: hypothetical protein JSV09_14000 [Thermoplasmata archaeon]|nr:MAG: hypothetical protein JSV09_14000 [Thermoplasmata archaeon]
MKKTRWLGIITAAMMLMVMFGGSNAGDHDPWVIGGGVYTMGGTAGDPTSPEAFANATLYLTTSPSEPIQYYVNLMDGDTVTPALFADDFGSGWTWSNADECVAVIETIYGVNGWTGTGDINGLNFTTSLDDTLTDDGGFSDLGDAEIEPFPILMYTPGSKGPDYVNWSWLNLQDANGNVLHYEVYRDTVYKPVLDDDLGQSLPIMAVGSYYNDTGPFADTYYFYQIAVNYRRDTTGGYHTTVGRSMIIPADFKIPVITSGPTVSSKTDTTATITWTTDEDAIGKVMYGLEDVLTDERSESVYSTSHSVQLTGLSPGRRYMFAIESTDIWFNTYRSADSSLYYYFSTKYNVPLVAGWNLVSTPLNQTTTAVDQVLSSVASDWMAVQWYDVMDTSDLWKHNHIDKDPSLNDLTDIDRTMATWVYISTPGGATFEVDGEAPILGYTNSISLQPGWNHVGYPSITSRMASAAISVPFDLAEKYDSNTGQWMTYDGFTGDFMINPGDGLWIHVQTAQTWDIDY